ncbi:MAG: lipid-binding SYLF domain-containing protein [Acidobacteria bacterium]|jgi:lipid-binding SYLF domain-containing protein|nr:lipid-binding SYLF domain-containing protein [Acidobacteriota bacterium]
MKQTIKQWTLSGLAIIAALSFGIVSIPAQTTMNAKEMRKQQKEGRDEVREATKVFREIMSVPEKGIPRELLEKAEAIGVFPNVVKAGFIVGGRGGDGVVARRTANGWSAPVFYNIGGASFGAQIGAKKTDYIMLFMNEGALRDLLDDKLEFEGDLSFAAGPIGRTVGAGTNLTADAGILIYSRSKGAFVGASIGGAVLTADNSINEAFYKMKAGEVLDKPESVNLTNVSADLRGFSDIVKLYAK